MKLTASLSSATTSVVIAGTGYNARRRNENRVLHVEQSRAAIDRTAALLGELGEDSHHWMEWPTVSLVFLDGRAVLSEYGVLSGWQWVRTSSDGDRAAPPSGALGRWLDSLELQHDPAS